MIYDNQINAKGLLVWFVCALFFLYEFLLRTVIGTFQTQLTHDLHLTPVNFALLSSSAYLLVYGLMQIPVGIIAERFGLKITLFAAAFICSLGTLGFSMVSRYDMALLFRILTGFGASFGFVCMLVAVYDWMPRKNIALFIGISQFVGTMGPMLAAGPLTTLFQMTAASWRTIFFIMAIIGFLLAILALLIVKNNQERQGKFIILAKPLTITKNIRWLLRQKQIWFIALFSAFIYFAIEYLSENVGVEFLLKKGLSIYFSSYMITLAWLGYALSCSLIGFISDKIQRRKPVMFCCAITAFLSLSGIIFLPLGEWQTGFCFFLLGCGASGQSLGFAAIAEECKSDYLAFGLGFNNAAICLFSAIIAPVIGTILPDAARLQDYQSALSILVLFTIIPLILAAFAIRETFCKSMRENTLLSLHTGRVDEDAGRVC